MDETGWAVLDEAHKALRGTVVGLGSAELAMSTPCQTGGTSPRCCSTRGR